MGRRRKGCRIFLQPTVTVFKPAGVPLSSVSGVSLELDALEAMHLVDAQGLSQQEAATQMGVSRPTLCRILAIGRSQVAKALSRGMAIRIATEGAHIIYPSKTRDAEDLENQEENDEK